MGSLRGWSGCNSRLFFWIYQSIAWQGVFLCSFFFLSCIGYGASWGHRIVQHTHPSPFSFSFAVNSSHHHHFFTLWGEYMGNDMKHTWHDTRRFYTGEGAGYIQPGNWGEGGRTTSREVSSHPSVFFFFFWLGFASSKFGWARDRFVAFFFFIVRSNVFFVVHHHYTRLGFSISLSRLSLTSPRCLAVTSSFPTC